LDGLLKRHRDALILLAVAAAALATRIPLLAHTRPYGDEILYALFGHEWLQGVMPYTVLWDVKPPGLFALYGMTEALSGDAFLAPRLLPLLATLAAVVGLWRIGVRWFGDANVGLVAAVLYCVNTLPLEGAMGTAEILFAPFIVFGLLFAASTALWSACLAGLLFGCAVMMKQTVAFEGALGLAFLIAANRGDARALGPRIAGYCLAGAAPALATGLYYFAHGHFDLLWGAVVMSALQRTKGDGVSTLEGFALFFRGFIPVLPLLVAATFVWFERVRLLTGATKTGLRRVFWWIVVSSIGILAVKSMYGRYFLTLIAPLSLAIAVLLVDLRNRLQARSSRLVFAAALVGLCAYPLVWVTFNNEWPTGDHRSIEIAQRLLRLGVQPGPGKPQFFVVDHEVALYLLTDTTPPSRYAFPGHLECPFPLPADVTADGEIDRIMNDRPRFVVISEPRRDLMCTLPERMERIGRHLDAHYVLVDRIDDPNEPMQIYEAMDPRAAIESQTHVQR
jgi:hypothetical protein